MTKPPLGDVFHAIADPRRRALLDLMQDEERPVQSLVDEFDVSFAAISQHLGILKQAGLVTVRREGRSRIYTAAPGRLQVVHDWTGQYRAFWRGRMRRLNQYLDDRA